MIKIIGLLVLSLLTSHAGALSKDRQMGAEISLLFPSAIVSYFDHDKGVEIALQVSPVSSSEEIDSTTADIHYRSYFDKKIDGAYWDVFSRFAYLDGPLSNSRSRARSTKLGFGLGLGYRTFNLFDNASMYWGCGIHLGAYVLGENQIYDEGLDFSIDDEPVILNIEFLKIGYAF